MRKWCRTAGRSTPFPHIESLYTLLRGFHIRGLVPAVIAFLANRGAQAIGGRWPGYALWFRFAKRLRVERMALRGQAASGFQIELPAMHRAGQYAVLNFCKARQVGLEMRTAALNAIAVALPELLIR